MEDTKNNTDLFNSLAKKACLKQDVYLNTFSSFNMIKTAIEKVAKGFHEEIKDSPHKIPFEYRPKGDFDIEMKFGGDILIFTMHTNVFEIPRDHFVMKTSYVREDKNRSYCGIINIYNFLSDSIKYSRVNDSGFLIGRILINKDMHYFIEGKREIGLLYNNFVTNIMGEEAARDIVESSIKYTINFDLLTPPYDNVKEVSVLEFLSGLGTMNVKTSKRLGFKFQADLDELD